MRQRCADTLATEEPDELIAHVRVCGGAGWVTIGSTRKPTPPASAPASLRLLARLTAGVGLCHRRFFYMKVSSTADTTRYSPPEGAVKIEFAIPANGGNSSAGEKYDFTEKAVRLSWWRADGGYDPICPLNCPNGRFWMSWKPVLKRISFRHSKRHYSSRR